MLKVLASHFGLESTGYGRAFRSKDEIFRIVSINPNRSKCPINAERVADGRGFEFPTDNVAIRLSSVHAIRMYILCSFKSPNMQLRAPYPGYFEIGGGRKSTGVFDLEPRIVLPCYRPFTTWQFPGQRVRMDEVLDIIGKDLGTDIVMRRQEEYPCALRNTTT